MPSHDAIGGLLFGGYAPPNELQLRGLLTVGDGGTVQSLVLATDYQGMTGFGVVSSNDDGTTERVATGTAPNPGEWYHVTMTRDHTSLNLYVDGVLAQSVPLTGKLARLGELPRVQIGRLLSQYFAGRVDDVRVYRRVLSGDEVAVLSAGQEPMTATLSIVSAFVEVGSGRIGFSGVGGDTSSLITFSYEASGRLLLYIPRLFLWWRLDEAGGSVAYDSSAYGHTGTLVNMEPADWVSPVPGMTFQNLSALAFDGDGESVECDLPDLGDLDGFSLSVWVNLDELPAP
jgi:hypothetical protein